MHYRTKLLALALAGVVATPAFGQYPMPPVPQAPAKSPSQAEPQAEDEKPVEATTPSGKKYVLSKQFQKAILELQTAVNARDSAAIPVKLEAARAAASSPDEKFLLASIQLKSALQTNDLAALRSGIEAMQASGSAETTMLTSLWTQLGKGHWEAKQYEQAALAFEKVLALDPNNLPAMKSLALARQHQGRPADSLGLMQKAFLATKAAGGKVSENDYLVAVGLAHKSRLPMTNALARDWVASYPSTKSWHDALAIHREISALKGGALIDNWRLAHAAGAISNENEYLLYVDALIVAEQIAEAKAVMDAAAAAGKVDVAKPQIKQLITELKQAPSRTRIDAKAKTALAGSSAKAAVEAGDAYYGIGAYAEAAAAYKAALGKSGVDSNLANLRLGEALARAGDKAGATAALNAVGGAHADTAKYWLVWLGTRA